MAKAPTTAIATAPVPSDEAPLTVEGLKAAMPKRQKHNITPHLVDTLNGIVEDPEVRNAFRENLVSYSHILGDPNIQLRTYLDAVRYVSFQMMGLKNQESWIKTFPDRYSRLMKQKRTDDYIRAVVSNYNRGKVVNLVREQAMVPTYILNADMFQKALNTQAELMVASRSDKVRCDAANSLLTHLKVPEAAKLQIDIGSKDDDSIRQLREAVTGLVIAQKEAIETGVMDADDVAKARLIDGESERVD